MTWWVLILLVVGGVVILQIALTKLPHIQNQESKRRFQHLVTGQALVGVSYILPISWSLIALWLGVILLLYVRHFQPAWYEETFRPILREEELRPGVLPGAFYFLLGTAAVATFFDLEDARYSVLCLAWADPAAAWVGQSIKSPKIPIVSTSTVAGSLGCFLTACLVGCFFYGPKEIWRISAGAAACTIAEACSFMNDNFVIPLAVALSVMLASG